MSLEKHAFDEDQLIRDFRLLAEKLADYGEKIGVKILPYRDGNLPHYSSLSLDKKQSTLDALTTYVSICSETIESGYDLASPRLTWFALNKLGLRPPSDFFDHVRGEDVIEFHTLEGIQIFRNFNFYDFCSYTLEELYCYPWNQLFYHDQKAMEQIVDFTVQVAKGLVKKTVKLNMPVHFARELYSESKNAVNVTFNFGAPLFDKQGASVATVTVETMNKVSDKEADKVMDLSKVYPLDSQFKQQPIGL